MFNKESLYINVIKQNEQLKLEYKKLDKNNIIEKNSSTFKVQEDMMPLDIALKINSSQQNSENTYISTLLFNDTTQLVKKEKASRIEGCDIANFNSKYKIAVLKNTLFETKNFFQKTGVDYVYSAFHLMNLYLEKNVCTNELLLFLYDNRGYILILDANGVIEYHKIEDLPSFDSVKKSHFYENDVDGQKLYEEIYYYELSQIIQNTLKDFYDNSKSKVFIEKATILYALKQLSQEQIDKLKEELALKIEYTPINIDEYLFELSREIQFPKSFIKARKKSKKGTMFFLFLLLLLLLSFFGAFKLYNYLNKKKEVSPIETKIKVELPDHINKNDKIYQRLKLLLDSIPYDVVLESLKIDEKNLSIKAQLLKEDTYIKSLKPQLEKFYTINQNIVTSEDKKINIKMDISSKEPVALQNINYKTNYQEYITDEFIPIARLNEQLKILMPENSIIKFKSSIDDKISKFIYRINILIKSPVEFFELINRINSELYSINIAYPINMLQTPDGLEVEFDLIFNQGRGK